MAKASSVTVEFDLEALHEAASHDRLVEAMLRACTAPSASRGPAPRTGGPDLKM